MKKVIIYCTFWLTCLNHAQGFSFSSIDKNCEENSDCILTDVSCNSCAYYAKWVATNKDYKHFCLFKKDSSDGCPEAIQMITSKSVCRSNKCVLKSPQELFNENDEFVKKLESHPLKKRKVLKCPEKVGAFYLSLPKTSKGIVKEKFYFRDLLTKDGMSSALKCYYRVSDLEESYVTAVVSFQLIGNQPIKTHFCERKNFSGPTLSLEVDRKFAITTSIKKYVGHKEKDYSIDSLKEAFGKIQHVVRRKYAIQCIP